MTNRTDRCDQPGPGSLAAGAARERILQSVPAVDDVDRVPIADALHGVLAEDIRSDNDVPGHTNSAVDGYAFDSHSLSKGDGPSELVLAGTLKAGEAPGSELAPGSCVRIMTGAILPGGADSVLMQEDAEITSVGIRSDNWPRAGANVRHAGEDIRRGDAVLRSGHRLAAADLGLLASLGCGEVAIRRQLKVAVLSTGDEVRDIGQPLAAGEVYDSNRYTLGALLRESNCVVRELGIIGDDYDALSRAFTDAGLSSDIVICSAGVSVGDADYTRQVLSDIGAVDFWKLAIKPGRPLAFGRIGSAVFFGLPGNPVAVMVTYLQFVLPAIRRMQGIENYKPLTLRAVSDSDIRKKAGRTEYCRGVFRPEPGGLPRVATTGAQGSGILSSMSRANCFITLDDDRQSVSAGEEVDIQPFTGFF